MRLLRAFFSLWVICLVAVGCAGSGDQRMKVGYAHMQFTESGLVEGLPETENAVEFIVSLRLANDLSSFFLGCWGRDVAKMSHGLPELLT